MLVIFLFNVSVASGASTQAEVEVLPNSVQLLPNGQETHVLVVLRNTSETKLSAIKLSWLNDEKIRVFSDIEQGKREVGIITLQVIARGLDTTMAKLLKGVTSDIVFRLRCQPISRRLSRIPFL
jgi:hypothetical protein